MKNLLINETVTSIYLDKEVNALYVETNTTHLMAECAWRLFKENKLLLASGDIQSKSLEEINNIFDLHILSKNLGEIVINEETGDCTLGVGDIRLELLKDSSLYEAWSLNTKESKIIALPDELMNFQPKLETVTIHVPLKNEGTRVYIKTEAISLGSNHFKLIGTNTAPNDQEWEFSQGDILFCENKVINGKEELVCIKRIQS